MAEIFSERNGFVSQNDNDEISLDIRQSISDTFENLFGSSITNLKRAQQDIMPVFGVPQDTTNSSDLFATQNNTANISKYLSKCPWYKVYDFVEYTLDLLDENGIRYMTGRFNLIFRLNGMRYRIVNSHIIPVTNEIEINEMKRAMQTGIAAVDTAYNEAVGLFSKKECPDYNAVIAKASNALESMVITIARDNDVNNSNTLGKALSQLEDKGVIIDEDMDTLLRKIYGYVCNAGVRHGGDNKDTIIATENDAILLLVLCAACINYINNLYLKEID